MLGHQRAQHNIQSSKWVDDIFKQILRENATNQWLKRFLWVKLRVMRRLVWNPFELIFSNHLAI